MPGLSGQMPGRSVQAARPEEQLLTESRRDIVVITLVVAVTVGLFAAVADHGMMSRIQQLDDAWLRLMISGRAGPLIALAKIFNILGLAYVTLPVRIAVAGFLAVRRRWWHLAAFVSAVVVSEVAIGTLKALYDRPRPHGSLVTTSGGSFPSGHAVAASVTVVVMVIALLPAGPRRYVWGVAAALFSLLMALSRAYLAAHWLSDAVAGTLLGTSAALVTAVVVHFLRERHHRNLPFAPGVRSEAEGGERDVG